MTIEIKVPALGESVSEATVGKWSKKEGDFVKADELLVELETDKVTLEVTAPTAGVIEKIIVKQGETVSIGTVLGALKEGAAPAGVASAPQAASQPAAPASAPAAATSATTQAGGNNFAMPSARKIISENSLDATQIAGTGKDGRITKGDALNAVEAGSAKTSSTTSAVSTRSEERVKMTRLRKRIAERLKESQNTAAILTTFNEIDMTNVIAIRNQYKDSFEKKHKVKLGFMSFFAKAAVAALKEIPAVNAEIDGEDIVYKNFYDIGVAVGTEQGLVVPVIRDADKKGFAEIEQEILNLAKKARDGKLSMQELTGGTFSITNGGIYGSLLSTPIINPPQSGILGMHKTMDRPVAINGKVEIRPMMYIALSYDHRMIDGKEAVTFLVRIKEYVENPERLLFDL